MIQMILREIAAALSEHFSNMLVRMGHRAARFTFAVMLARVASFCVLLAVVAFAFALFKALAPCIGPACSGLVVGGFFLLTAIFLLFISLKLIKKK